MRHLASSSWHNEAEKNVPDNQGNDHSDMIHYCLYGILSPDLLSEFVEQLSEMCFQSVFSERATNLFSDHVRVYWPGYLEAKSSKKDVFALRLTSTFSKDSRTTILQDQSNSESQQETKVRSKAAVPISWEIGYYGPPEHPRSVLNQTLFGTGKGGTSKGRNTPGIQNISDLSSTAHEERTEVNMRAVHTAQIEGDIFLFMELLGYKLEFEYDREGYRFLFQGIRIELFRVRNPAGRHMSETCSEHFRADSPWIVEVSAITKAENTIRTQKVMVKLAESLKNFTDLHVIDHKILEHKVYIPESPMEGADI